MRSPAKQRFWRTVLGVTAGCVVAFGVLVFSVLRAILSVLAGLWKGVRRIIF